MNMKGLALLGRAWGMAKRKEVGVGVCVGVTMTGWPAGTRPKRGWDIFVVVGG
jgi:hypothetical protein